MKQASLISLLMTMLIAAPLNAQNSVTLTADNSDSRLTIQNIQVNRTAEKSLITMEFVIDSLHIASNRYKAFTPVIRAKDGSREQRLKTVIVSGRRQNIVFQRDGMDPLYRDNYELIGPKTGAAVHSYTAVVQNEPWHRQADIYIESDLCGCGDRMKNQQDFLTTLLPPDPFDLIALVDRIPQAAKKERSLHGSAYVTFVVNKWDLKPDYMNNRQELRKITDTLDVMAADPNVSVRQIRIHGYASPESPYDHNSMLATNRAQALTDWLRQQYQLPQSVFATAQATPEDWDGLRSAVANMSTDLLPHRQDILAIIDDNTLPPDPKEWRIKMRYPDDYSRLLRDVYPGLRRTDYDISFNFNDFTLEQALQVYRTRPYQLSVRELWDVAHTYEPNSDEYNRALQTALNVYPDDPVANLNMANVALRQHDLLKAETLLQRAGDSPEADNTRAALAIVRGQYQEADGWLRSAEQKGFDTAPNRQAISQLTR